MGYRAHLTAAKPSLAHPDRLRALADDWEFYEALGVTETRHEMQRAVLIELEHELKAMRAACELPARTEHRFPSLRRNAP